MCAEAQGGLKNSQEDVLAMGTLLDVGLAPENTLLWLFSASRVLAGLV